MHSNVLRILYFTMITSLSSGVMAADPNAALNQQAASNAAGIGQTNSLPNQAVGQQFLAPPYQQPYQQPNQQPYQQPAYAAPQPMPAYGAYTGYGVPGHANLPTVTLPTANAVPFYHTGRGVAGQPVQYNYHPITYYTPVYIDPYLSPFGLTGAGAPQGFAPSGINAGGAGGTAGGYTSFPYYSYRRPWSFRGPAVYNYNTFTNSVW